MPSYRELYSAWYFWRPTHPKKRKGAKGDRGFAAGLLALPFLPSDTMTAEQFARLERRAPQVIVKVTKPTFGADHTFQNMTYIARHCEEEILDQDGSVLVRDEDLRRLADEWHQRNQDAHDGERRYRGPDARRFQFSMPPGTEPQALRNAVSATARHVFGDRYDYVYALHTDRPHPHVHLTVRTVGHDGQALRINKDDLVYLRRALALALRMRGVEADATPQIARGPRVRSEPTEVHRSRQRRAETEHLTGGERGEKDTSLAIDPYVRRVYEASARRLQATGRTDDGELARRIERFAADRLGDPRPSMGDQAVGQSTGPAREDIICEEKPCAPKPRI